jgi:8-hydroxy-5-deazaflavin:NADPH oxidoreductase
VINASRPYASLADYAFTRFERGAATARSGTNPSNQEHTMILGIIGAGNIGQALARQALRAGHQAVLANSRGPDSLRGLAGELGPGATAGTTAHAADGDLVAIAVPWGAIPDAVDGIDWTGRIVIDATNPMTVANGDLEAVDLGDRTSSEVVGGLVRGARLVKGANTLPAAVLAADPRENGGRRVLTLAGDDDDAKTSVAAFFDGAGFATIDLGGLVTGGRLQQPPAGVFAARNLVELA